MPRRLLIIYTGGTIGMVHTREGLAPSADLAAEVMNLPELGYAFHEHPPTIDTISYEPLIDSSDMTPKGWIRIAEDIRQSWEHYDGFVVLHGTDTLAYTSSALSYFVERTGKPVVVTGAQLPFGFPRSDARNNLISAIEVAATMPTAIAQVCVVFGTRILRGNRTTKVSAKAYDAFDSPRYPALGAIGSQIDYRPGQPLSFEFGAYCERGHLPPNDSVAVVRLFPGFSSEAFLAVASSSNMRGIILEAYGTGNGPGRDRAFLAAIRQAVTMGVVVIVVAQPLDGVANLESYAAGSALAGAGAVSGRDLTTEAALAKLYYLIALGHDDAGITAQMKLPIAGELN